MLVYHGAVARAVSRRLSGKATAQALLWQLLMGVRHRNEVFATNRDIARVAGFDRHTVGKALEELQGALAIRRPKPGLIEVNPYLLWAGADAQREQEQMRWSGEMAALAPEVKALTRDATGKVVQLEAVQ